ncbi:MAG: quinone-dependent dihydroorotate dehydrogenase [Cyclobacteriaceae bacterium]|nr:quinone-dependent dihydroorotate dehydrogenase [Cyclobacteriaceae bacterium HetDA_MAG_MS6]
MYHILKHLLFLMPAERAHYFTTGLLRLVMSIPGVKAIFQSLFCLDDPRLQKELFGLTFKNPVGLAAGFDKNAELIHQLPALGFGFLEVGTVTPKGQPGNPKPRLFRLKSDEALINRMGFNNAGMDLAAEKLKNRPKSVIIGGNIGKNKVTPNEQAKDDYLKCFEALFPYVDYFVVNVSSPNTPDLRQLQDKEPLAELLQTLKAANNKKEVDKPILLKIAPDINTHELSDILEIIDSVGIDGIIATNTTVDRAGLATPHHETEKIGNGGLSGKPLRNRSTEIVSQIRAKTPDLPIIAVGGIYDEASAIEKLDAGADLVQIYTGFVYEGPGLIKRINKAILKRLTEA